MLRRSRLLARDRLEAWPRAPNMLPSFETVARVRERLPQDDVPVFVRSQAWWARLGSNQRPLRCQRSALPLSYAPDRLARDGWSYRLPADEASRGLSRPRHRPA